MVFVKVVKNKAYYKNFQTKYRRRQEGKTDFQARRALIIQDKDKYNTPKYRLVARRTCTKIIAQIIYATIKGDKVLCAAESNELRKFGLTAGLSNYSAAYLTGLLLARRTIKKLGMEEFYKVNPKIDGEVYNVGEKPNENRRPFKAVFDTGLARTSTGARIFGVLKGGADGGLYIPHSNSRFPGFKRAEEEGQKDKYDAKVHRERIFGAHVDKYMKLLKGKEQFKIQFSRWEKTLQAAKVDSVEKLVKKVIDDITKNPDRVKKDYKNPKRDHKKFQQIKLTLKQRKDNIKKKFEIALKQKKAPVAKK